MPPPTARAVVLVNRGSAGGASETTSKGTVSVRVLPDGPEGTIRDDARNHQWALMTHGMEIPVYVDPAGGAPAGLVRDELDEAIGRHLQQLEPDRWPTWQEAIEDRRRALRRGLLDPTTGIGDAVGAAKSLPGGIRSFFRELRKAREPTGDRKAARVTAIEATDEQEDGNTVYAIDVHVMDSPAGRHVVVRQALSAARAAQLAQSGYTEVTVDPADPDRVAL